MSLLTPNPYSSLDHAPTLEGAPVRSPAFRQTVIPQAGGPSDPPSFNLQVLRSLRMHGALACIVGIGVALLLAAFALTQPKVYTAQSVVYVEPNVAKSLNEMQGVQFDQFRYGSYLDQQMQTVVRPDIVTAGLKTLPAEAWHLPGESDQAAIKRITKKLVVERLLTSYQFSVKLSDANPDNAAAIVNAITNSYLKGGRKDELAHSDGRLQLLGEERQRVREELEADRKEQASLGASMGVANPVGDQVNSFDASTANLRTQLQTARQQRDVAQAQLESVSGQAADNRSGLEASADEAILTDAGLSALKTSVNQRRVVLQGLMAGLTPNNPQYRQDQDELADLDRSLEAKTAEVRARAERRIQDKLRTDLQRTAEVEAKLNQQLGAETAKATHAGPKLQRAQELAADITRLTSRYSQIDEAYSALEIDTGGPSMSHLAVAAQVPAAPDPSKTSLFLLAALPCGLLFGVSSAVVARLRDGRIYLGSDLEHAAGFSPIAVLPAREDVSQPVTDEYVLRLAAGIESAYRTASAQTFIVTAASPDTPTAALLADLARKLEDLRLSVRVVQARDLLVTSQETLEHRAATAELLASAGAQVPAGEGIAAAKLDRMKGQNDILLIESEPLLHSAATEYAARCADATILVVESGTTVATELTEATSLLSRLHVSGVALVLDHLRLENADEAFRRSVRVIQERTVEPGSFRKGRIRREAAEVPIRQTVEPAPERVPERATWQAPVPAAVVPEAATAQAAPVYAEPLDAKPIELAPVEIETAPQPAPPRIAPIPLTVKPAAPPVEPVSPPVRPAPAPKPEIAAFEHLVPAMAAPVKRVEGWPERGTNHWPALAKAAGFDIHAEPAPAPAAPLAVAAAAPVAIAEPEVATPRGSFKNWTAEPAIAAPADRNVLLHPIGRRAAGLDVPVPVAATPARESFVPEMPIDPPASRRPAHPTVERAKSIAAAAPPDEKTDDDLKPVGRFISETDKIIPVPAYTRSKIRQAFKEQEVNSKTTWFSKLFRGDPPSNFRVVPEDDEEDYQHRDPVARPSDSTMMNDPAVQSILNRIKPKQDLQRPVRPPRPVQAIPEPPPVPAGPPVPFVERRAVPRPIEDDEAFAPQFASPAPAPWAPVPATPAEEHPVPQRPLRPLTFQELSGGSAPQPVEAESEPAMEFRSRNVAFPPVPAQDEAVSPPWPARDADSVNPRAEWVTPSAASKVPVAEPWKAHEWQIPEASVVPSAHVEEVEEEREPVQFPSSFAQREPVQTFEPLSEFRPEPVPSEPMVRNSLGKLVPVFTAYPSPSERAASFERTLTPADPFSDPEPSPRPYRLEPAYEPEPEAWSSPNSAEAESPRPSPVAEFARPVGVSAAAAPEQPELVLPGTSFPPDREVQARLQSLGRRSTDTPGPEGEAMVPGLTRRWALLSQFEPNLSDPAPAPRRRWTDNERHVEETTSLPQPNDPPSGGQG